MHNDLEWNLMKGIMLDVRNQGLRDLYNNLTMPEGEFNKKYPITTEETKERELGQ